MIKTVDPISFFAPLVLAQSDERLRRVPTFLRTGFRSRHLFGDSVAPSYNGFLRDAKVRTSHRRQRVWVPHPVKTFPAGALRTRGID
jgi:hypothetical protein